MAKETQALKAHIDSKRWKKIIYANDNKKKSRGDCIAVPLHQC